MAEVRDLPGARLIQPPTPAPYWEAPCDDGCAQGTKRARDIHGGYDVSCSKCGGTGKITERRLRDWEERQRPADLF